MLLLEEDASIEAVGGNDAPLHGMVILVWWTYLLEEVPYLKLWTKSTIGILLHYAAWKSYTVTAHKQVGAIGRHLVLDNRRRNLTHVHYVSSHLSRHSGTSNSHCFF